MRGKIIRVLEVGSGTGKWITAKARKNPSGVYVALDPAYAGHPVNPATREFLRPMREAGVVIRGTTIQRYLLTLIRNKTRVRTINADLPTWRANSNSYVHALLAVSPKVLLPNGRIFMTVEKGTFEKEVVQNELIFAREMGFVVSVKNVGLGIANKTHDTKMFSTAYGTPLKLVIFTLETPKNK